MSGEAVAAPIDGNSYEAKLRKGNPYAPNSASIEEQTWQIAIEAPGYKKHFLGPLRLHRDGDRILPTENGQPMKARLLRNGQAWRPRFACHTKPAAEDVPNAVRKLQFILAGKKDCEIERPQPVYLQVRRHLAHKLLGKPTSIDVGTLSGLDFHMLDLKEHRQQAERARAALLNIAHALNTCAGDGCTAGEQPNWLDWVERILLISEERVIARVSPQLYNAVRGLEQNTPAYACQVTVKASAALHQFSDSKLRKRLGTIRGPVMVHSVKTPVCQGNVQITAAKFQTADGEVYAADFDIDENFKKGAHLWDVFIHFGSGRGTDPYEMYEMLLARGKHRPKDLGYELVRLGEQGEQCPSGRNGLTADGTAAGPN